MEQIRLALLQPGQFDDDIRVVFEMHSLVVRDFQNILGSCRGDESCWYSLVCRRKVETER